MRCVSGAGRYRVAAGPGAGRARHGAVRGGGVPAPAASAADYCRVERAPYPRLSAQRPAAKWQLYDPQQGEVRFSPQTWLIQDDFAAIAAAVQQGMGIARLPDWLVAQALADGTLQQVLAPSAQVRFAIHAVWPEGPWLPQKRGRRSMPCGKGYLLPQHRLAQREITAIYGGGGFPTACKLPARFTP